MDVKNFYFDFETTGTRFWKNGIHQIAGIIEINGEEKERLDFKVKPYHAAIIEDEALAVGNVTREIIAEYMDMAECHRQICMMLGKYVDKFNKKDKFFLIGYNNASFDNPFLRAFFTQCNDNYFGSWFWSSSMDAMVLASEYLKSDRHKMIDFKQSTVAKELGIEIDETKLHDAVYDVQIMIKIYKHVTHNWK
jgi:DNA polymerase-3 subunit epsilon